MAARFHKSGERAEIARALTDKSIVVTRARLQAPGLAQEIENLGGRVIEFPTIEIGSPNDFAPLDAAVNQIENYDWVIFTSVNGVEPFLQRLQRRGKSPASLENARVGAIGPETAKKLAGVGITACLVPERFQAEGILDAIAEEDIEGKRVLIPRAAEAREILPNTLRDRGASVDVVTAYRTLLPATEIEPLAGMLRHREVDVITFTSSSTVKNFVRLFQDESLAKVAPGVALACIGPITARTVAQLGGRADIVADEFTVSGLVRAIVEHFRRETDPKSPIEPQKGLRSAR